MQTIRVILAGSIVEVYRGVSVPFRGKGGGARTGSPTRQANSALRAKRMVRWLSSCNAQVGTSYFFTATFADNIQNYDEALKIWIKFRRLLQKMFPKMCYICVPEIQPRSGRWHFHALLVGLPDLDSMRRNFGTRLSSRGVTVHAWQYWFTDLWSRANGGGKIHRASIEIARSLGGVCGYLAKYLCKDVGGVVPVGRRNYYAGGKGLKFPIEKRGEVFVPLGTPVYTSSWKDRFGELSTFERYVV